MLKKIDRKIGEILITELGVKEQNVKEVLELQKIHKKSNFGTIAKSTKLIDAEKITEALCIQFGIKYMPLTLANRTLNPNIWNSEEMVKQFGTPEEAFKKMHDNKIVPFMDSDGKKCLAISFFAEINDINLVNTLTQIAGGRDEDGNLPEMYGVSENWFSGALVLDYYAPTTQQLNARAIDMAIEEIEGAKKAAEADRRGDIKPSGISIGGIMGKKEENTSLGYRYDDYLRAILIHSIASGASDIHIDPTSVDRFRVSYRIDGNRITMFYMHGLVADRIFQTVYQNAKITDLVTHSKQDGQIDGGAFLTKIKLGEGLGRDREWNFPKASFRVSFYPVDGGSMPYNEEISIRSAALVIRLIGADDTLATLSTLSLSEPTFKNLKFSTSQTAGIILVCGPTGSGKTTTLYAALGETDFLRSKILTFEDPVENRHPYMIQGTKKLSPENTKNSFDFNQAAASALRQDPDVILMGEIRDRDSARFAIDASNTGHLVLATLHSNSAVTAITRLKDLGVPEKDTLESVALIFAQRLANTLCPQCKIPNAKLDQETLEQIKRWNIKDMPESGYTHNPDGCSNCAHSGFKGRILVDESILMTPEARGVFLENESSLVRRQKLNEMGLDTLVDNFIRLVKEGIASIHHINRFIG